MSTSFWDKFYDSPQYRYGELPNRFVIDCASRFNRGSQIGCFAEGEGRNAVFLAEEGHKVTAIDQSTIGLKKAEALATQHGVEIETSAKNIITDEIRENYFDVAINVFGHVHKDHQATLFQKMIDSTKPEGIILLELYSEEQLLFGSGGPSDVDYLYNPKQVFDFFEDHYIGHFYYGEADRFEGDVHRGRCHIIQLLVRL